MEQIKCSKYITARNPGVILKWEFLNFALKDLTKVIAGLNNISLYTYKYLVMFTDVTILQMTLYV